MKCIRCIEGFLQEEEGQGTIEYLLMVGSIMVAAAMIASSYYKMAYNAEYSYIESVDRTFENVCGYIARYLDANATSFCVR